MVFSPLEQFQLLPYKICVVNNFDFSLTNGAAISFVGLSTLLFVLYSLQAKTGSFCIVPNHFQLIFETFHDVVYSLLDDNLGSAGKKYFPYVFSLFLFIVVSNIVGLVPYSFTITSHLIVTFSLALSTFIGINLICIRKHGINILNLFLPPGSSFGLALLLIPIELVSYIFRPISLSVRLFANMMAGHTLLKVIAGFAWVMLLAGGSLFVLHFFPLAILVLLMGLELGVALIQAYVFAILVCIYLNDALRLH